MRPGWWRCCAKPGTRSRPAPSTGWARHRRARCGSRSARWTTPGSDRWRTRSTPRCAVAPPTGCRPGADGAARPRPVPPAGSFAKTAPSGAAEAAVLAKLRDLGRADARPAALAQWWPLDPCRDPGDTTGGQRDQLVQTIGDGIALLPLTVAWKPKTISPPGGMVTV